MTDKQIIIDDQKKTIHRLQDECTEKTNIIIALGEQLDQLKTENDSLKSELMQTNCYLDADKETIDQLKTENDSLKRQLQFEFDETLLQYSNTIEDLQKQLKDSVMQKCPQCGETYLNPVGTKLYEALIEIKELVQSDYCTEIGSCEFCAEIGNCLNRKILHKISECEGNNE